MELFKSGPGDLSGIVELRQEVLHPGGPKDRVVYAQDEEPSTVHLILKSKEGEILVTGTLILESEDGKEENEFRIRGMAVRDLLRGKGFGSKLIDEFIKIAREKNASKIWCNARVKALSLYERKGFVKTGDPFDVPGSGPHYRMQNYL